VFSGEKTQLSSEFQEFEREVDVKRIGIERYVPPTGCRGGPAADTVALQSTAVD
jgi:hypothetical protein